MNEAPGDAGNDDIARFVNHLGLGGVSAGDVFVIWLLRAHRLTHRWPICHRADLMYICNGEAESLLEYGDYCGDGIMYEAAAKWWTAAPVQSRDAAVDTVYERLRAVAEGVPA